MLEKESLQNDFIQIETDFKELRKKISQYEKALDNVSIFWPVFLSHVSKVEIKFYKKTSEKYESSEKKNKILRSDLIRLKNFLSSLIAAGKSIKIESNSNSNEIRDLAIAHEDGFTSSSTLFDKLINALAVSLNSSGNKACQERELKINLDELDCLLKATAVENGKELKSEESSDTKDNVAPKDNSKYFNGMTLFFEF
jgi:hypothetical protein